MYMILTVHFFCWWLSAVNRFIRDWSTVQILLPRMKRGDLPISGRSRGSRRSGFHHAEAEAEAEAEEAVVFHSYAKSNHVGL